MEIELAGATSASLPVEAIDDAIVQLDDPTGSRTISLTAGRLHRLLLQPSQQSCTISVVAGHVRLRSPITFGSSAVREVA